MCLTREEELEEENAELRKRLAKYEAMDAKRALCDELALHAHDNDDGYWDRDIDDMAQSYIDAQDRASDWFWDPIARAERAMGA